MNSRNVSLFWMYLFSKIYLELFDKNYLDFIAKSEKLNYKEKLIVIYLNDNKLIKIALRLRKHFIYNEILYF
jgi:hypothetical protein